MRLQHLHLLRPVPYPVASRIQDAVVRQHIDFGLASQRNTASFDSVASSAPSSTQNYAPQPFLLTFQTTPTYTCGRREIASIGPERIAYLRAGGRADFHTALRGGQTTWHGPGQLTAYLVLSLRSHELTPRCYVRFLESAVIDLCARLGIPATTTTDPGVWLAELEERNDLGIAPNNRDGEGHGQKGANGKDDDFDTASTTCELSGQLRQRQARLRATDSKICAVGVHMRRGVTSHGLGLNVRPDLAWFRRIVACGLEGKRVTSLDEIYSNSGALKGREHPDSNESTERLGLGVRHTALMLAEIIANGLHGVNDIDLVDLIGSVEPPRDFTPPFAKENECR